VFLPGWDDISTLHDLIMADQMFKSGRLYINIYSLQLKQFLFTKGRSYYGFHIQGHPESIPHFVTALFQNGLNSLFSSKFYIQYQ